MEPLLYQWHFDPLVLLLVLVLIFLHYRLSESKAPKKNTSFWSAIALILLTSCSPLHFLAMHVYFSAHMITHVVLLLIAGPLLVISLPAARSHPALQSISAFLHKRSWLAWMAGVGVMWCWHIPAVFEASIAPMRHFTITPLLHTGTMLVAGALFSWPLVGPSSEQRIHPLSGVLYLFTACISCSLLGLLITFAPLQTFHYKAFAPATNAPPMITSAMNAMSINPWNLSPSTDQQAAGLIMWVPCCFVYLSACVYLLLRWFSAPVSYSYSTTKHE
jgi:putative membrane protein